MKNITESEFRVILKSALSGAIPNAEGIYRIPISRLISRLMTEFHHNVIYDIEKIFLSFKDKVYRIVRMDIGLPEYGMGLLSFPQYRIYELVLL